MTRTDGKVFDIFLRAVWIKHTQRLQPLQGWKMFYGVTQGRPTVWSNPGLSAGTQLGFLERFQKYDGSNVLNFSGRRLWRSPAAALGPPVACAQPEPEQLLHIDALRLVPLGAGHSRRPLGAVQTNLHQNNSSHWLLSFNMISRRRRTGGQPWRRTSS